MTKYNCCKGNPNCAINAANKFIDKLFTLYKRNPKNAKERLFEYVSTVETERDYAQYLLKENNMKTPSQGPDEPDFYDSSKGEDSVWVRIFTLKWWPFDMFNKKDKKDKKDNEKE